MRTMIDADDLAGTAEVAALLECPKQQIRSLQRNPRFPKPITHLKATPVWDRKEVMTFKETWKRRPPKDNTDATS